MGLLSARGLRNIAIGAGTGMLNVIKEAKASGEQGLEELKIAREEVNQIATKKQQQYNKALKVGDRIGGGAFANYVFNSMSMENIANLDDLQPTSFNDQMTELKKGFDSLPTADKAIYEKGSYAEEVKASYNTDIDRAKKEKGLTEINNVPSATAKLSLSDVLTRGVSKEVLQKSQEEVSKFETPTLAESKPVPMEFKSPEDIGLTLNKKIKNLDILDSMYEPVLNKLGEPTNEIQTKKGFEGIVDDIENKASLMIQNGFQGNEADAKAVYMESLNDPNFENPALRYLTMADENSQISVGLQQSYNVFKNSGDTTKMLDVIETLESKGLTNVASKLRTDYDSYLKETPIENIEENQEDTQSIRGLPFKRFKG